jgi:hypothetical protein
VWADEGYVEIEEDAWGVDVELAENVGENGGVQRERVQVDTVTEVRVEVGVSVPTDNRCSASCT